MIDLLSVLTMWRVKKLNISLSPSSQPVSRRAPTEKELCLEYWSGGSGGPEGPGKLGGESPGPGECVESLSLCRFSETGMGTRFSYRLKAS